MNYFTVFVFGVVIGVGISFIAVKRRHSLEDLWQPRVWEMGEHEPKHDKYLKKEVDKVEKDVEEIGSIKRELENMKNVDMLGMKTEIEIIKAMRKDLEEMKTVKKDLEEIKVLRKDVEEIKTTLKNNEELRKAEKEFFDDTNSFEV
jgi:hypothetical protein